MAPGPSSPAPAPLVSGDVYVCTRHPGSGSGSGPEVGAGAGDREVRDDSFPPDLSPAGSERHSWFCQVS